MKIYMHTKLIQIPVYKDTNNELRFLYDDNLCPTHGDFKDGKLIEITYKQALERLYFYKNGWSDMIDESIIKIHKLMKNEFYKEILDE